MHADPALLKTCTTPNTTCPSGAGRGQEATLHSAALRVTHGLPGLVK